MRIIQAKTQITDIQADAVVVGVYADGSLSAGAAQVDQATDGALTRLVNAKEITGKRYELVPLLSPSGMATAQVLVVGLGSRDELDRGTAFRAAAAASRQLAGKERQRVAFYLADDWPSP